MILTFFFPYSRLTGKGYRFSVLPLGRGRFATNTIQDAIQQCGDIQVTPRTYGAMRKLLAPHISPEKLDELFCSLAHEAVDAMGASAQRLYGLPDDPTEDRWPEGSGPLTGNLIGLPN